MTYDEIVAYTLDQLARSLNVGKTEAIAVGTLLSCPCIYNGDRLHGRERCHR